MTEKEKTELIRLLLDAFDSCIMSEGITFLSEEQDKKIFQLIDKYLLTDPIELSYIKILKLKK